MPDDMDRVMLKQIAEIEQKDESQVLAELAGEQIEEMIYTVEVYDRKKKQLVQKARLSWAGTKEVARSRGNIVLAEPVVTDLDATIRIMVKATDLTRNFTVFGGCQQPRKMKINDVDKRTGEIYGHHFEDDAYCFQKGLSKCQRNALTVCIPADYAARCITRFLKVTGKSKQLPQEAKKAKAPAKSQIKPLEEWEKITEDRVPDRYDYHGLGGFPDHKREVSPHGSARRGGVNDTQTRETMLVLRQPQYGTPDQSRQVSGLRSHL